MTPKERAAMQQALEALVKCNHFHDYEDEITALREALAEQAEQEPVAWITPDGEGWRMRFDPPVNDVPLGWTPLYAAPIRTKDLTDDEIDECRNPYEGAYDFARAVIAADREKNK